MKDTTTLQRCLEDELFALELNPRSKAIEATVDRLKGLVVAGRATPPENGLNARIILGLATLPDLLKAIKDSSSRTRKSALLALERNHPEIARKIKIRRLLAKVAIGGAIALLVGLVIYFGRQ